VEASPPPEAQGWIPGQATCVRNSFVLIIDGRPELGRLCMIMVCPLWRLYIIE